MATMKSAPGSRLPRPKPQTVPADRGVSAPVSKLELVRQQYQAQIQKAKEEKLREMYYQNPPPSNKALLRLTSNPDDEQEEYSNYGNSRGGGNVRDYFQQRRTVEQQNNNSNINRRKSGPQNSYADMYKQRTPKPPHVPPAYKGVGRDKSKPLAPISRDNSNVSSNAGLSNTYTLDKDGKIVPFNRKAVHARGKSRQRNAEQNLEQQNGHLDTGRSDQSYRERPVASGKKKAQGFKQWQEEQRKKKETLDRGDQGHQPQSDYQKWQQTMVRFCFVRQGDYVFGNVCLFVCVLPAILKKL